MTPFQIALALLAGGYVLGGVTMPLVAELTHRYYGYFGTT